MAKNKKQSSPRPQKQFRPTHRLVCTPDHIGCTAEKIEEDKPS